MTDNKIKRQYIGWLTSQVTSTADMPTMTNYGCLFEHLFDKVFTWEIDMDSNRATDGLLMRTEFEKETGLKYRGRECRVLEMLVALSKRCEINIMSNDEYGDRTYIWFWTMMSNLGLDRMDDEHYDAKQTEDILDRMLHRQYKRNGEGGLFKVQGTRKDFRTAEIWYQMCWYLSTLQE